MTGFGGPETVTIQFLRAWPNGLFIHPDVDNADARLHDFLITECFAKGWTAFDPEISLAVINFRDMLGWADGVEILRIIDYYRYRARNYAHLARLSQALIRNARVSATIESPSSRCTHGNGESINIGFVESWMRWCRTLSHEEYRELVWDHDPGFPPCNVDCKMVLEGVIPRLLT